MEETAEKTAEKTSTWLALRNPSSAKRKMPPHSEHAYLGTSVPVKRLLAWTGA